MSFFASEKVRERRSLEMFLRWLSLYMCADVLPIHINVATAAFFSLVESSIVPACSFSGSYPDKLS